MDHRLLKFINDKDYLHVYIINTWRLLASIPNNILGGGGDVHFTSWTFHFVDIFYFVEVK